MLLRCIVGPFIRRYAGFKGKKNKGPDTASLIITNHDANLDPALVALSFSRHIYYLASEHVFRLGFPSRLLNYIAAPISFNKVKTDLPAIKEMILRLRAGANVCLFAEGDRSFNGVTGPIVLSTAKLAKTSGADLITYRLEGGYFVTPRWAKKKRKGVVTGAIANIYTAERLKTMSAEEVLEAIKQDLYEDAYAGQKEKPRLYPGKKLAEDIELALYVCPQCKNIGTIKSEDNRFFCTCGLQGIYAETGFLEGESLPFDTITKWDRWQVEYLSELLSGIGENIICADEDQQLYKVRPTIDKTLIGEGPMSIDRKVFRCAGKSFPVKDITRFAIAGRMELLFALKDGATYEVHSKTPRSALKYREIFKILDKPL
jgi:1-acyl-sn-glycerol-3-phosphate acyltransferase